MPYCSKCRTFIPDGVSVCPGCGNTSGKHAVQPQQTQNTTQQSAPTKTNKFKKLIEVDDYTFDCDQNDINTNTNYSYLSYIGLLVIIPLLVARKSKYAMFHACQGLLNSIFCILYSILLFLVSLLSDKVIFGLLTLLMLGLMIVFPILSIVGIVNVARKKAMTLPLFGKLKLAKYLFKNHWDNM